MKKKFGFGILIFLVCVFCVGCLGNSPSLVQQEFDALILKIQKLEEISVAYNEYNDISSDANLRVMQYIRNGRYNDDEWNEFGGLIEADFIDYVEANEGNLDLSSLQTIENFVVPSTKAETDFVHMVAIINVFANSQIKSANIYELVGFGGDLCQLAVEVKNSGKTANDLFMSKNSSFSSCDLYADLDAVNLSEIYNNLSSKSLSVAISTYYKNLTLSQQKTQFIENALYGLNTTSVDSLAQGIMSKLQNNIYLKYWAMQNGLNFTNDDSIILACVTAFADYLV